MVTLLLLSLLAAHDVSLELAPGVVCVDRGRLTERLSRAGLGIGDHPRLAVRLEMLGTTVHVVGHDATGRALERNVPVTVDDCPAVERIIGALILSWAGSLPAARSPVPTTPPRTARVVRPAVENATPTQPEPETQTRWESEPEADTTTVETSTPPIVPVEVITVDPTKPAPVAATKPGETKPGPSLGIDLSLLGGAAASTSLVGLGQLELTLRLSRWGLRLDGGLDSARVGKLSAAQVSVATQWLSLAAVLRLDPTDRLRVELALAVRGWRIAAVGSGADQNFAADVFTFGGTGSARLCIALNPHLSLLVGLFASARWRTERFVVENLGTVLNFNPWDLGALSGLQVSFF